MKFEEFDKMCQKAGIRKEALCDTVFTRQFKEINKIKSAVDGIIKAQDFLIGQYGEEGYKILVNKIKEKTHNDPVILLGMLQDETLKADIRLVVLASFGE